MAVAEAAKEALWLSGLSKELGVEQGGVQLHCDSLSAIYLAKNQGLDIRQGGDLLGMAYIPEKRIDVGAERLRLGLGLGVCSPATFIEYVNIIRPCLPTLMGYLAYGIDLGQFPVLQE
ncbi:UNVERIFIED_CONTAM: hypothetical protein Scaly_0863300 [Sesamum calycinum]|uniref:Uncharacterized protein n=1 Tax=Sesamum calycinum TaxID=2727403 RepID=A0AAW2QV47_9LAMI